MLAPKNLIINNFVVVKIGEEWFEGRVAHITQKDEETLYNIYVFRLYSEISSGYKESALMLASPENIKKFRIPSLRSLCNSIHFPHRMEKIMNMDQSQIYNGHVLKIPTKYPISRILNDFKVYMQTHKSGIFEEELDETLLGFYNLFESTFYLFLLYSNEKKAYGNNHPIEQVCNKFGGEHLVRLLYLIQSKLIDKLECRDSQDLIFDYSIYLLDFLDLYAERYFSNENYHRIVL